MDRILSIQTLYGEKFEEEEKWVFLGEFWYFGLWNLNERKIKIIQKILLMKEFRIKKFQRKLKMNKVLRTSQF